MTGYCARPWTLRAHAKARQPVKSRLPRLPWNKALKLTKGAAVRAPRHSASIRRGSVPQCTFITNVPSQLNAVFYALAAVRGVVEVASPVSRRNAVEAVVGSAGFSPL
jgi:hypothetical protein